MALRLQCGRCDWTCTVDRQVTASLELRRHARSCAAGPHPIGREHVFVHYQGDNTLPVEPHLVALVERLSDASGPDSLLAKIDEFRRTVEELEPEEINSEALEVLDDLAYDLSFYSPRDAWEDASLLDEEKARSLIARALQSLRANQS